MSDKFDYICDGQMSLFDWYKQPYKVTKPVRLIELFAGIGSQAMALRDLGVDFEHHRVVEWDKYAIKSYNAIHGTDFPTMDITKISGDDLGITDCDKFTYLLTYSFPCTDLSVAGKMQGMAEGSGTRSSLLWEVRRLLEEVENLPQILLMENVPQIHSKSNMPHFQKWLDYLESKGYSNFWQDMNANNYGVAQSRNRTIAISILGDYTYSFPKGYELDKNMKHYLEDKVDEKYYLLNEKAKNLIDKLIKGGKILTDRQTGRQTVDLSINSPGKIETANCIKARVDAGISNFKQDGSGVVEWQRIGSNRMQEIRLGNLYGATGGNYAGNVYDMNGLCPTINTCGGGGREPMIAESKIVAMRGRDPENPSDRTSGNPNLKQRLEPNSKGIANTITTVQKDNLVLETIGYLGKEQRQSTAVYSEDGLAPNITTENIPSVLEPWIWEIDGVTYLIRIRKLTPRECWRLMDFRDEDFDKAQAVNSNTQLYKQAGNSIVRNVLVEALRPLFSEV